MAQTTQRLVLSRRPVAQEAADDARCVSRDPCAEERTVDEEDSMPLCRHCGIESDVAGGFGKRPDNVEGLVRRLPFELTTNQRTGARFDGQLRFQSRECAPPESEARGSRQRGLKIKPNNGIVARFLCHKWRRVSSPDVIHGGKSQ